MQTPKLPRNGNNSRACTYTVSRCIAVLDSEALTQRLLIHALHMHACLVCVVRGLELARLARATYPKIKLFEHQQEVWNDSLSV